MSDTARLIMHRNLPIQVKCSEGVVKMLRLIPWPKGNPGTQELSFHCFVGDLHYLWPVDPVLKRELGFVP